MGLESRLDLAERIGRLEEEADNAEEEIAALSDRIREFEIIHSRFETAYGKKFGINRRKMSRRIDNVELDRLMHLIRVEDAQPQRTGFLGIGGMKREEYDGFTDRLNLVDSNLKARIAEWNQYIDEKTEKEMQEFEAYEGQYLEMAQKVRNPDAETAFPETIQRKVLYLGDLLHPMAKSKRIAAYAAKAGLKTIHDGFMDTALTEDISSPEPCCILYEGEQQKKQLYSFVQNLFFQVMISIPLYQYEFYYLDGMNNGSGLREFLDLQNMQDAYVNGIVPQLCERGFQMLHVGRDTESIRRELEGLETYMAAVTDLLQGKASIWDYNEKNEEKIPYKIVILEDIAQQNDAGLIRKLVLNGAKCGIFVLLVQDNTDLARENYGNSKSERKLLTEGMAQILLQDQMTGFSFAPKDGDRKWHRIELPDQDQDRNDFIAKIFAHREAGRVKDNSFYACFPEDYPYGQYTSTQELPNGNLEGKIEIPFAVDTRGRISGIELGSANFAHGLISGATGSGKSTMLHMLINSVVMNYRPDDVEIWLADYKMVEFSVYINERPPHVKFIGIERNEEFTFCLLDLLSEEFERRLKMVNGAGCRNIDLYKQKYGMGSLARILLIIDEFHLMSQQVYDNPIYAQKLENLLAEGRAMGIVCLFADQAISKGLNGLTPKGKEQMRMRLAMNNSADEMAVTLDVGKVTEQQAMLDKGEVQVKRTRIQKRPDGTQERIPYLDLEKVIYLSDECRRRITQKAIQLYGDGGTPMIVDGKKAAAYDRTNAKAYEKQLDDGRPACYLHLGKPSNLDPCFAVPLTRNYGDNVICILDRPKLQRRLFLASLQSFLQEPDRKVYVLADDNDDFFCRMRKELRDMCRTEENLRIESEYDRICNSIFWIHQEMRERRSKQKKENILVIWLGLESMVKEFSFYPQRRKEEQKQRPESGNRMDDLMNNLDAQFAQLFGTDLSQQQSDSIEYETAGELFNATQYIVDLIQESSKRGIYHFVFYSSVLALKMVRELKTEYFKYKISGGLSQEQCFDFYGTAKFMKSMGEKPGDRMVCHDGTKARFFLPYLTENEPG